MATPSRTGMSPRVNRRLRMAVPLIVLAMAAGIIALVIFSPKMASKASYTIQDNATAPVTPPTETTAAATTPESSSQTTSESSSSLSSAKPAPPTASPTAPPTPALTASESATETVTAAPPAGPVQSMKGLLVRQHPMIDGEVLPTLGGLDDPDTSKMELEFTRVGGGIAGITFSNIWLTAEARRQAGAYFAAQAEGSTKGYELPDSSQRYVLRREQQVPFQGYTFTISLMAASGLQLYWLEGDAEAASEDPLAALGKIGTEAWTNLGSGHDKAAVIDSAGRSVEIHRQLMPLLPAASWLPTKPGGYRAEIVNEAGDVLFEILRQFQLGDGFDITIHHRVINRSGRKVGFQWQQYGPPSLNPDRARYMDRRRFRFGYEFREELDPNHLADVIAEGDMLLEYGDVSSGDNAVMWPNDLSREEGYTLSWFASTNRYFALAVHPVLGSAGTGQRSLEPVVQTIERSLYTIQDEVLVETALFSPIQVLDQSSNMDFSLGLYAGPLSSEVLDVDEPYVALNMGGLLLYQISAFSCCAFCTFQWLAELLLDFLSFLANNVVFDWGMAIIILVLIVRVLLHPITRMSQVNMQKFSRKMQKLKPEMDRLKEKCGDDKRKFQQEQMKLMREQGINPMQMLGCAPMVLQMPIWIALYAGLYFSYSLRQEPAFWGFFQLFDGWPFLADLAAPDHFFYTFPEPVEFLVWHLTGINLLPILLGVFFYIQQKYLTPQGAALTAEQQTQQKIMRVMTVVLFPLFLYTAPSGLTLYILTSSIIGSLEGRHIRKQVDRMELDAQPRRAEASTVASRAATAGPKIGKDAQSRAYARALERRKGKGKGGGGKRRR